MPTIETTFQLRRGNASEWTTKNPVLAKGEPGFELDTGKIKYGDGTTAWNNLSYSGSDKQDVLTAGDYITIENNVISASSETEVFAAVYDETTFDEIKENVYAKKKTLVTLNEGNIALEFNYIDYDNIYFGGLEIGSDSVVFIKTSINSNDEWSEPTSTELYDFTGTNGIVINKNDQTIRVNYDDATIKLSADNELYSVVPAAEEDVLGGLKVNYDSTSKILYLSNEA